MDRELKKERRGRIKTDQTTADFHHSLSFLLY